jgi:glycine/D-amino acid oxidase-like deaminating enzyme
MSSRPNVLIVGTGIIGASIAHRLAGAGVHVTMLEQSDTVGGASTRDSFAWINASIGNTDAYYLLRVAAMDEWRRLTRTLPDLHVNWCGSLKWDVEPERMADFVSQHSSWGYRVRIVTAEEARVLEPNLAQHPEFSVYAPDEGSIEALEATERLLFKASAFGARVQTQVRVSGLLTSGGAVIGVSASRGAFYADETVLAAGVGTVSILQSVRIQFPMTASPAILLRSSPLQPVLRGIVMTPRMYIRQGPDGLIVVSTDLEEGTSDISSQVADIVRGIKAEVVGCESLTVDYFGCTPRAITADGLPVVGRVIGLPGLYVATMHSGVTLAPLIGRLVTEEILDGSRSGLLQPFTVDRLVSAYTP